jgi:hypothetical protein
LAGTQNEAHDEWAIHKSAWETVFTLQGVLNLVPGLLKKNKNVDWPKLLDFMVGVKYL